MQIKSIQIYYETYKKKFFKYRKIMKILAIDFKNFAKIETRKCIQKMNFIIFRTIKRIIMFLLKKL